MKITLCGSMKFYDKMVEIQKQLEVAGHTVFMPLALEGLDYWQENGEKRIEAKRKFGVVGKHMDKVEKSDAILVTNFTKGDIPNYIGANTFLEMGFAHYRGKKIFILNPLPDQKYINEELTSFNGIILDGDLGKIV